MSYAQRWQLAVALKQPYPSIRETGDVAPDASSSSSTITSGGFTVTDVKTAFENLARGARVLLAIGTGLGLVVGGAIGYAIGKSK